MVRLIAQLVVGALLFTQLALAAHTCPNMAGGPDGRMSAGQAAPAALRCIETAQPDLCAAHCEFGQQNADAKSVPTPTPMHPAGYYMLGPRAHDGGNGEPAELAVRSPWPVHPPHAILHCCLRI